MRGERIFQPHLGKPSWSKFAQTVRLKINGDYRTDAGRADSAPSLDSAHTSSRRCRSRRRKLVSHDKASRPVFSIQIPRATRDARCTGRGRRRVGENCSFWKRSAAALFQVMTASPEMKLRMRYGSTDTRSPWRCGPSRDNNVGWFDPHHDEMEASRAEILECRTKNPDFHSNWRRSSFFAWSQSSASMRPAAKSASVFGSSSSCQAGLANAWSSRGVFALNPKSESD